MIAASFREMGVNPAVCRGRSNKKTATLAAAVQACFLLLALGSGICADGEAAIAADGAVLGMSGFGEPLQAIAREGPRNADLQLFEAGQRAFVTPLDLPQLGPLFNNRSCITCHFEPAVGGSGEFISEIRVRDNPSGGPVHIFATDNILRGGPQSQGGIAIFEGGLMSMPLGCQITNPNCKLSRCQRQELAATTFSPDLPICDPLSQGFVNGDNCTAERQSPAVFGFGLVEAIADRTLIDLASSEPPAIRGSVKILTEFGRQRVGRFGWKDDGATLRAFATMATANELGLTTPDHPNEVSTCGQGQTQFGVPLDVDDDPEDRPDGSGHARIDRMIDFMRALAPPPELPEDASARRGHQLFEQTGCAGCHVETVETSSDPAAFIPSTTGGVPISASLAAILSSRKIHPFSDFLLHDMGSLGDGITSGAAGPTTIRTPPLWGLRSKVSFLHDGRTSSVSTAITLHNGQGKDAAQRFQSLTPDQHQDLLHYLGTI